MEIGVIVIILIGLLGPLLIYLTRKVVKGRTSTAMRLWFVSIGTYLIYYLLANGVVLDAKIAPYYFTLLWPIPAILTFWFLEKTAASVQQSPIHFFKWIAYFLVGVVYSFVLDVAADAAGWYSYDTAAITGSLITNPLTGAQVPAAILLMMGVMMMGVFFLCDNVFRQLRQKIASPSSVTYLLIGLSFVLGGFIWVLGDLAMRPI